METAGLSGMTVVKLELEDAVVACTSNSKRWNKAGGCILHGQSEFV
jgi:hypothetical protein